MRAVLNGDKLDQSDALVALIDYSCMLYSIDCHCKNYGSELESSFLATRTSFIFVDNL